LLDASEELLTIGDASAFLKLKPRTLYKLVREGRLGCIQVTAKERRFTRDQLAAYVEAQTITPKIPIDRKPSNPLPSSMTGGERRKRVKRVSGQVSIRKEIMQLCQ
jgi:excisionase family DNA binding protein